MLKSKLPKTVNKGALRKHESSPRYQEEDIK